jgi:hypothetical protein
MVRVVVTPPVEIKKNYIFAAGFGFFTEDQ